MQLKQYDNVKLTREYANLAACGIKKGCLGTIVRLGDKCLVLFYNKEDFGDRAWAWVDRQSLTFVNRAPQSMIDKFAEWVKKQEPTKKVRFEETHLREYDTVEVTAEKKEYLKEGVSKGMTGTILEPKKIEGCYMVYFCDDKGEDIAVCAINEKHLKLVNRPDTTEN